MAEEARAPVTSFAMPRKDTAVMSLYESLQDQLEQPSSLQDVLDRFPDEVEGLAAVFVPGGHGAMLGLPDDPRVGTLLRAAHDHGLFTITLCHGPGSPGAERLRRTTPTP